MKKEAMIKHESQYKSIGIKCEDSSCDICISPDEEWKTYQLIQAGMSRENAEKVITAQTEFKNAVWQYMIDHSRIQPNGYLGILFYCKNRKDFFERVKAREEGFFRYDAIAKESNVQSIQDKLQKYEHLKSVHRIALKHNWFIRSLAKLYQKLIIDSL